MRATNYYGNSLISLEEEEEGYHQENESSKKRTTKNKYNDSSSNSFFKNFINSIGKIGQGLKYIMSMKINIEDDDNSNNQNVYDQVSNRFNTNEEISMIDAPSFLEESSYYTQNKKTSENKNKKSSENKNNINSQDTNDKMIISNNETKKNIFDEKQQMETNNSFLKSEKQEIINTDIVKNNNDGNNIYPIKSFLNKKRGKITYFEEEQEKNNNNNPINNIINEDKEEEKKTQKSLKMQKSQSFAKKQNKNKKDLNNTNSINNSNKKVQQNLSNSSIMSLSMKSLDKIKSEINQRREMNLSRVESMHKKHGLYYDYLKEQEIREKILEEYYKEKAKRISEEKIKMEKEKRKREEEFQKLKIRKASGLKFCSMQKKPTVFSQIINNQIQLSGLPQPIQQKNTPKKEASLNNSNVTFGKNDSSGEKKNQINEKHNDFSLFTKMDENNDVKDKNSISLFADNKKGDDNENKEIKFDNKKNSIFGDLIGKKDESEKTSEKKDTQKILTNEGKDTRPTLRLDFLNNPNKTEDNQKKNTNDQSNTGNQQQQQQQQNEEKKSSLFSDFNNPNLFGSKGNNLNIFSTNNDNNKNEISFFGNQDNNKETGNNKNEGGLFNQIKKEDRGLFDQQSQVSSGINSVSLFSTNQQGKDNQHSGSLLNVGNPFLPTGVMKDKDLFNFGPSENKGRPLFS